MKHTNSQSPSHYPKSALISSDCASSISSLHSPNVIKPMRKEKKMRAQPSFPTTLWRGRRILIFHNIDGYRTVVTGHANSPIVFSQPILRTMPTYRNYESFVKITAHAFSLPLSLSLALALYLSSLLKSRMCRPLPERKHMAVSRRNRAQVVTRPSR